MKRIVKRNENSLPKQIVNTLCLSFYFFFFFFLLYSFLQSFFIDFNYQIFRNVHYTSCNAYHSDKTIFSKIIAVYYVTVIIIANFYKITWCGHHVFSIELYLSIYLERYTYIIHIHISLSHIRHIKWIMYVDVVTYIGWINNHLPGEIKCYYSSAVTFL